MLNTETVNTFLAVVRAGSFLQAAEIVGASQSTVSQRIRMLEQYIGRTLILRTRGGRSLSLSEAGQTFLELAERWVQIEVETEQLKLLHEHRLALGAVDSLSIFVLPDVFSELAEALPPIYLHLETGRYWQLQDRVATGHLHAAFTLNPTDHIDLIAVEIAAFEMVVVTAHGNADCGPARIDLGDLRPEHEFRMEWSLELDQWRCERTDGRSAGFVDKAHLLLPLLRRARTWALIPSFMIPLVEACDYASIHQLVTPPPRLRMFLIRRRHEMTLRRAELAVLEQAVAHSLGSVNPSAIEPI